MKTYILLILNLLLIGCIHAEGSEFVHGDSRFPYLWTDQDKQVISTAINLKGVKEADHIENYDKKTNSFDLK